MQYVIKIVEAIAVVDAPSGRQVAVGSLLTVAGGPANVNKTVTLGNMQNICRMFVGKHYT